MPLKLLGKKSWHVYNADNIARVRRDEAEARAREEDEERQQRTAESSQRAAILRGEVADTAEQAKWQDAERATKSEAAKSASTEAKPAATSLRAHRPPRKRYGEDDTDYEMRIARTHVDAIVDSSDVDTSSRRRHRGAPGIASETERPLVDRNGHIDLFGQVKTNTAAQPLDPAPDAPASSMRFADAAGGRNALSAWYAGEKGPTAASKPSFLNNDKKSKNRPPLPAPAGSMAADPLAAMRQGAAAVRALKQERQHEMEERNRVMSAMVAEQDQERERRRRRDDEREGQKRKREHHHHERRRDEDSDKDPEVDSLAGFTLDGSRTKEKKYGGDSEDREKRRHSYRDRREDDRDDRYDRHKERRHHHNRERRHHYGDRDRERSHHRRDRDDRDRNRERDKSTDRSTQCDRRDDRGRSQRYRSSLSPKGSRPRSPRNILTG